MDHPLARTRDEAEDSLWSSRPTSQRRPWKDPRPKTRDEAEALDAMGGGPPRGASAQGGKGTAPPGYADHFGDARSGSDAWLDHSAEWGNSGDGRSPVDA